MGFYDVLVVIGDNMEPVIPGASGAMFLHVAHLAAIEGCIAVDRAVLLNLIPLLAPRSAITISN
jgi:L,D-peptidoglycan transpeptidase YkuD (ErfK/YbiS/YcfS/YnhG family)